MHPCLLGECYCCQSNILKMSIPTIHVPHAGHPANALPSCLTESSQLRPLGTIFILILQMEKPRVREVEYISRAFPISFCPAAQGWQGCDLDPDLSRVKLVPSPPLCPKTSRAPFQETGSENHGASPSPPPGPVHNLLTPHS